VDTFFELQKDSMLLFEEDAVENGFKALMEKDVNLDVNLGLGLGLEGTFGEQGEEEKKESEVVAVAAAPPMPLGLAMLLAGGESF